jgi:hypothetical protein
MFVHPCSVVVFSPSGGGKTTLILRLIREREKFLDVEIDEILYFYNVWNEAFDGEKDITFVKDDQITIPEDGKKRIVVVDDLVQSKLAQERLVSLFLVESHHKSCTVFYSSQMIFYNSKTRAVSVNAKVFCLFGSPRNYLSVANLFSQMIYDTKYLKAIYKHATSDPHGFLMINLQKNMSEELRFCSRVFDSAPCFYVPVDFSKRLPLRVSYHE